jgi:hypothetical protein
VQAVVQAPLDRQRHVETDRVEVLERAHRVAVASGQHGVDRVEVDVALPRQPDRAVQEGEQQRVDDEPSPVAAPDRALAE